MGLPAEGEKPIMIRRIVAAVFVAIVAVVGVSAPADAATSSSYFKIDWE